MLSAILTQFGPFLMPLLLGLGGIGAFFFAKRSGAKKATAKIEKKELERAVTADNTRDKIDAKVARSAPTNANMGGSNARTNKTPGSSSSPASDAGAGDGGYQPGTDKLRDKWTRN